ncbi:MAG: beta-glucosidase [Sphingobacteriales bacterium]|nr:MAG: beta-glucosidase [Sphingobacteriales bacterium]
MQFERVASESDFKWGVSTASYQIEGAWNADGKGRSIWDVFANTRGKIKDNSNANIACDFYHRYAHDITIMSQLGIPNFRFSISWSRILPDGIGPVNMYGIDFYNRVIDLCLELGITPWITLYHWDLPYELEKKGGWTNREIINWFGNYVEVCIKHFSDRVSNWVVLNEPMAFTGAGYFLGVHAPGRKGLSNFLAAAHHAAICQADGGRIIKSLTSHSNVGTSFSATHIQPYTQSNEDVQAAVRVDALLNRTFVEPLAGMGYPIEDFRLLQRMEQYVKDGDESRLAFDMDFVGLQTYTRDVVSSSLFIPFIRAKIVKAQNRKVERTAMNWEIYPEGIYHALKKLSKYNFKEIIVTENGAAFPDHVIDGRVIDTSRTRYLEQHIAEVLRARREGVNVNGYFVWSFTDNFEWAEGYQPRFGLVHINYATQQRTIKHSGYWYSKLVKKYASAHSLADVKSSFLDV